MFLQIMVSPQILFSYYLPKGQSIILRIILINLFVHLQVILDLIIPFIATVIPKLIMNLL